MTDRPALLAGAAPRAMTGAPGGAFNPMLRGAQVTFAPDGDGLGGLSVEEAVAHLDAFGGDEEEQHGQEARLGEAPAQAAEGAQAGESQQSEGETRTPEDAAGEAENPPAGSEEAGAEEGAVAPLEPPKYWSQDAKARFAELNPDLQAVVLAQEGPREEASAKAKAEAAEVRQHAEKEMEGLGQLSEQLNQLLPRVLKNVADKWGTNPDWVAFAGQYGADKMAVAKAQYEQDRAEADQLQRVAAETDARAHVAYVRKEYEALKELAPELTDPKEGQARRTEVVTYLKAAGVPEHAITKISALEMTMVRKAMLFDRLQTKAATPTPAPKPAPAATRPLTRGAAAVGSADPKAKQAQAAGAKFSKSRSIADAVALLDSLGD